MSDTIEAKMPIWAWGILILLALWGLMGLWVLYDFLTTTPESMAKYVADGTYTQAYADYYMAFPMWHKIVFGIAVISGACGALGLVLRKAFAAPLYRLSLLMVIISTVATFAIEKAYTVMNGGQIAIEGMVLALGILGAWFASMASARGWLK